METALINCADEERWEAEEEEEALSLCDLPVYFVEEENQVQSISNDGNGESQAVKTEEDFNFGSWGGSLPTEPAEMCAADEVFFKGQILPLRHSISSDSGLAVFRQDSQNASRCLSRSESLDHGSLCRFTSVSSSSRSSSHHSTSSSNSIIVTTRNLNSNSNSSFSSNSNSKSSKPMKIRNNFNTHPSPKPQIRVSKTRPVNVSNRNQKSSMWDVFRLGLVRAPELELQDLKVRSNNNNANRNSVSRNSSCNSSNSSSSTKNSTSKIVNNNNNEVAKNQQDVNKSFLEKRLGLFSGCKCSVNAVETVPLNNIVVIKNTDKNNEKEKAMSYAAMEEKKKLLQELKLKKKMKEKEREKKEGKQALSRHRTFEWLKELSHASYDDEA